MSKRCPYCGESIRVGVAECKHCGKSLGKKNVESTDAPRLTSLDSWKKKSVPTWFMFLMVALALFCVWLMFAKGCEGNAEDPQNNETAFRINQNL